MGACLDTGATTSVIGTKQAEAYGQMCGQRIRKVGRGKIFHFGKGSESSHGILHIRIPTPNDSYLSCNVDVVNADIPFLLGLDIMSREGLLIDLSNDVVKHPTSRWISSLTRMRNHIFLSWNAQTILYTRQELHKLHLHFFHPSARKLFNLVKRAHPTKATAQTRRLLEEISKSCSTCTEFSTRGLRFKVSMPEEDLSFNQTLAMDLMYLDNKPVLHVVDVATGCLLYTSPSPRDQRGSRMPSSA